MVRPLSGLKQTKDGKLYQAMDGQAVGLYDSEECTFWFVTKGEAAQEGVEALF